MEHCDDGRHNGITGDVGSDGSFPTERVARFAKATGVEEESRVKAIVPWEQAMIEGVLDANLNMLFNPHAKFAGATMCDHKTGGVFGVMLTAESVIPTKETLALIEKTIK
jgi:hypothetical protein